MNKSFLALLSVAIFVPVMSIGAAEPGTIGVQVSQIYIEQPGTHRGGLIVRHVEPTSGAAEAGLHPGDLIVGVGGRNVEGHERKELLQWLNGPAGATVQLTVISQSNKKEVTVHLKPYPPHINSELDRFRYQIPGDWTIDPRYTFPLPWAPRLSYDGFEDVGFSPGFDDPDSAEYHSYFFLWELKGESSFSRENLQNDLTAYYRGLSEQRGHNKNFTPDLSQIHVLIKPMAVAGQTIEGNGHQGFEGSFTVYDRRGQVIDLNLEAIATHCQDAGDIAVLFFVSRQHRPAGFWDQLDAIKKSFTCKGK